MRNINNITLMTCACALIILLLCSFSSSFLKSNVYRNRREALSTSAACCKDQNTSVQTRTYNCSLCILSIIVSNPTTESKNNYNFTEGKRWIMKY